ncbi:DNA-processing protein DprA [Alkalibacter mobilis]|uniref:DNA-processing protein DprA n=1 Tax=Alkalibacter mobilis TaxID=2787712 RepID=UPI0018A0EC49|nr:DNA-processing protein DprA [Alkalibacter mobilis]MBF7097185.1 DNA-protecting protein DprA [Alkalibacter mobilis]
MNITEKILILNNLNGVGSATIRHAYDFFGDFENTELKDILRFIQLMKKISIKTHAVEDAVRKTERTLKDCRTSDIDVVSFLDETYPGSFSMLANKPPLLYIKGNRKVLDQKKMVALIGTRNPTKEGERSAYDFGFFLAQNQVAVLSGLALGCDAKGHVGALSGEGITIAVLPSGINNIYPEANFQLSQTILDSGGTLISEYAPNEKAENFKFVARDRLQASLAKSLLVIETDIVGGTMHTVNFAKELQKTIGVVKYEEMSAKQRRGNRVLLEHEDYITIEVSTKEDLYGLF